MALICQNGRSMRYELVIERILSISWNGFNLLKLQGEEILSKIYRVCVCVFVLKYFKYINASKNNNNWCPMEEYVSWKVETCKRVSHEEYVFHLLKVKRICYKRKCWLSFERSVVVQVRQVQMNTFKTACLKWHWQGAGTT